MTWSCSRGNDDRLWWKRRIGGSWGSWEKPLGDDGTLSSNPTGVAYGDNQINLYIVGTDNQVYERWWVNYVKNDGWKPRGRPGFGIFGHVGASSWGVGRLNVFARGNDNRLWQAFYDGSNWTGWFKPVGDNGTLNSAPESASWEPGHVAVFTRGTDGGVYWLNYDQRRSGNWTGWNRIGCPADSIVWDPRTGSRGCHRLDVFGRGTDNKLYRYRFIS